MSYFWNYFINKNGYWEYLRQSVYGSTKFTHFCAFSIPTNKSELTIKIFASPSKINFHHFRNFLWIFKKILNRKINIYLHRCKYSVVKQLLPSDFFHEACFVICTTIYNEMLDVTFFLIKIIELGQHLHNVAEVALHPIKICVWIAMSPRRIIDSISLIRRLEIPKTPSWTIYKSTQWCGTKKPLFPTRFCSHGTNNN